MASSMTQPSVGLWASVAAGKISGRDNPPLPASFYVTKKSPQKPVARRLDNTDASYRDTPLTGHSTLPYDADRTAMYEPRQFRRLSQEGPRIVSWSDEMENQPDLSSGKSYAAVAGHACSLAADMQQLQIARDRAHSSSSSEVSGPRYQSAGRHTQNWNEGRHRGYDRQDGRNYRYDREGEGRSHRYDRQEGRRPRYDRQEGRDERYERQGEGRGQYRGNYRGNRKDWRGRGRGGRPRDYHRRVSDIPPAASSPAEHAQYRRVVSTSDMERYRQEQGMRTVIVAMTITTSRHRTASGKRTRRISTSGTEGAKPLGMIHLMTAGGEGDTSQGRCKSPTTRAIFPPTGWASTRQTSPGTNQTAPGRR
ncbi:hypothetical protein Bbelb_061340 [Branchiostoma belcheri]|nr:hypothetical protein Bbelb_061340 [Branchiostoma belcheri]